MRIHRASFVAVLVTTIRQRKSDPQEFEVQVPKPTFQTSGNLRKSVLVIVIGGLEIAVIMACQPPLRHFMAVPHPRRNDTRDQQDR
ncbi:MAG: hypothetical protein HUU20_11110 [Pirellulales bacterium]|nr:hypothetical protein [Pirellulales bacterium]